MGSDASVKGILRTMEEQVNSAPSLSEKSHGLWTAGIIRGSEIDGTQESGNEWTGIGLRLTKNTHIHKSRGTQKISECSVVCRPGG